MLKSVDREGKEQQKVWFNSIQNTLFVPGGQLK